MNTHKMPALAAWTLLAMSTLSAAEIAAPTLTNPAPGESPVDARGFIRRWMLLEPIDSTGLTDSAVQAAVHKSYFPDQFTILPRDGDKVKVSETELTWHAVETKNYNVNLF